MSEENKFHRKLANPQSHSSPLYASLPRTLRVLAPDSKKRGLLSIRRYSCEGHSGVPSFRLGLSTESKMHSMDHSIGII